MGPLLFRGISTFVLYSSVALAVLSTSKKDLERAAELAVERAAEKAAERAVEKALNSGNSSTITVTVKESYSNAKKTAEEAAAPGSESTRPYDPTLQDSRYAYEPLDKLRASGEEVGRGAAEQDDRSLDYERSSELRAEGVEEVGEALATPSQEAGDFDNYEAELDFDADIDSLEIGSDATFRGNFGLKSTNGVPGTRTFSRSYSLPESELPETKVDQVDDNEAARIFKMYAAQLQNNGWSSSRQHGWIRHRPLWDDGKLGRMEEDREFWKGFHNMSPSESSFGRDRSYEDRQREEATNQLALPGLTTLDFAPLDPPPLYQPPRKSQRAASLFYKSRAEAKRGPIKLFITIPVAYPPSQRPQQPQDGPLLESMSYYKKPMADRGLLSPKLIFNKSYGIEGGGGPFFYASKNVTPRTERQVHAKAPIYRSIVMKADRSLLNL